MQLRFVIQQARSQGATGTLPQPILPPQNICDKELIVLPLSQL